MIALYVKGFYDRYTQYRRETRHHGRMPAVCAIYETAAASPTCIVETRDVRIGEDSARHVLNYTLLRQRCDVDGFLKSQVEPLACYQNPMLPL